MKIVTNKQQKETDKLNILKLIFAMQTTHNDLYTDILLHTNLRTNYSLSTIDFSLKAKDIYLAKNNTDLTIIKQFQYYPHHITQKPFQT